MAVGGGAGSEVRSQIFENTQKEIETVQIKILATGGSIDQGYSTSWKTRTSTSNMR
jgi:hypothetical protein